MSVTGTVALVIPDALIWIAPLYVPAAIRDARTETINEAGVVPLVGVTVSQDADVVAVKLTGFPPLATLSL